MVVDGKSIQQRLTDRLVKVAQHYGTQLTLGVIVIRETPEIVRFVALKEKYGAQLGVTVKVLRLDVLEQTNEALLSLILHSIRTTDGMVVQLPLPGHIDRSQVFRLLPLSHDVDVLGDTAYTQFEENKLPFLPPVVGAFAEVLHQNGIGLAGRKVVVVGEGRLVGAPAATWAHQLGAHVIKANKETVDLAALTRDAEVVILGAGSPGLLTPDMIREGAIVLDAGTSEEAGVIRGDADPAVAEKARLFTPTPGGIGPITVAKLFENLFRLYELKQQNQAGPPALQ